MIKPEFVKENTCPHCGATGEEVKEWQDPDLCECDDKLYEVWECKKCEFVWTQHFKREFEYLTPVESDKYPLEDVVEQQEPHYPVQESFKITAVAKEDMLDRFKNNEEMKNKILAFDDSDMIAIASKMADAYCNCCFWVAIDNMVEDYGE